MKFKTVLTASACAIALALPVAAHAQFGGLLGKGSANKGASTNVGAEVEKFTAAATDASALTSKSLVQMIAAVSSTEKSTALAAALKAAEEITNPQEREAAKGKISTDAATDIQKIATSKEGQEKVAALDTESKTKLSKSFFNYALGVLRAKDVIPQGQNVIKSVSANPMEIGKVASVKDALPHLQSIVTNSGSLMTSIPALFKQANIAVTMPSAANAKAEDGLG